MGSPTADLQVAVVVRDGMERDESLSHKERRRANERAGKELEQMLLGGAFQVVKGQYFVQQHDRGERIQMRPDISRLHVWMPADVGDLWAEHGAAFLVAVTYSWLSRDHPDPERFHLERLAWCIREHRERNCDQLRGKDVGIVIDYCSFVTTDAAAGTLAGEGKVQLDTWLEQLHQMYYRDRVMVWRLEEVPEHVPRKFADRGWTLLESCIVDAKCAKCVRTLRDGAGTLADPMARRRGPPLTPERFELELERRGERARDKGVELFANEEDRPLVVSAYRRFFKNLGWYRSRAYDHGIGHWGLEEVDCFLEALPECRELRDLKVLGLQPEVGAHLALGIARLKREGRCQRLSFLELSEVPPEAAAELERAMNLDTAPATDPPSRDVEAEVLAGQVAAPPA